MVRTLKHEEARAFYDRFGAKQDSQAFYEDPATVDLVAHGAFDTARAVVEFGCGTGRFAEGLLADRLPAHASYLGIDISATMVGLARKRLARWGGRAQVVQTSGSVKLDAADASFDRFVTNFVVDLLSEEDIRGLVAEAHRVLAPDGLLCVTGLTHGRTVFARLASRAWARLHALNPRLVGGCRPVDVLGTLPATEWEVRHHAVVTSFAISSEVVVARRC
jgi:ubiquinone/menaquinone biosynthesis C-methylase UbiE